MRDFVVHSIPGSPYGRAVLLALEEKGVAYRFAAMAPGDHRSAAYLAKHPFGRVPVLEHGDFTLYETAAILRYLERTFPEPALTPLGAQPAARMDQLMNICDWYFSRVSATSSPSSAWWGRLCAARRRTRRRSRRLCPMRAAFSGSWPGCWGISRIFAGLTCRWRT
jgi:glutathione S-transferase